MTGATHTPPGETLTLLRRLFAEHGRLHLAGYALAGLCMALGAAATALAAYLLKPVLNHMVEPQGFESLQRLAGWIVVLFLVRGAATYGTLVLLARTGNRIVADVQTRLFRHLLHHDMAFFQDRHSSEFLARLAIAANGIRDTLQALITSAGRDALTLLGLLAVMVVQDPVLSLIAVVLMPAAAYGLGRLVKRVRHFARRSFDGTTAILQILQETLQGIRVVKSFNLESVMADRMGQAVGDVERSANHASVGMALASPLADVIAGTAIAAVILYGSWRIKVAGADPGAFFSFIAALLMAYDPAKRLSRLHLEVQAGLVGARLIYDVLDRPAVEVPRPGLPRLVVSQARIAFECVRFSYRADEAVLSGLDLVFEPGTTTALVGMSGAGKSTILMLMQRFYAVAAGRILIDGQDAADVDLASLRAALSVVNQDVFLFRGSIGANIGLGRPGASEADIVAAARKADAHSFITGFAAGYATPVGEQGLQLSAGQRQRLAIARAILEDAPILLLDEPTAALDAESERAIQRALDLLRLGRTTIVVAHRLQTIMSADRIYVIEAGRAIETGTHAELMSRKGAYHSLFVAQFAAGSAA